MLYAINYDLKQPGRDYESLYDAIKSCGAWWHYLESTWIVDTSLDAQEIWDKIGIHCDSNDRVLVISLSSRKQGWLPKDAWEWINDRL